VSSKSQPVKAILAAAITSVLLVGCSGGSGESQTQARPAMPVAADNTAFVKQLQKQLVLAKARSIREL